MVPILLFGTLIFLLIFKVPIGISLGLSCVVTYLAIDMEATGLVNTFYTGLSHYTWMAVPMFLLAGALMERGGISRRLIQFADSIIGRIQGGLAIATVLACAFFAAISGSGPATTAAVGSIMIPTMIKRRYNKAFAGVSAAAGGTLGILIPPSVPLIIYGISAQKSVTKLFTAGFLPGFLLTIILSAVCYLLSRGKGHLEKDEKISLKNFINTTWNTKWSILAPLLILGGIYSGIYTPTEAAVIGVFYGLFAGAVIYRELSYRSVLESLKVTASITGTVAIIWAAALAYGELITLYHVPQYIAKFIFLVTRSPFLILMMISLFLLFVGMWMNTISQIILLTPIFLPIIEEVGIDPYQFGIIFVLNCEIGFLTPPLGTSLFVAMGLSDTSLEEISVAALPFIAAMIGFVVLVSLVPGIVLFLPNLLGM